MKRRPGRLFIVIADNKQFLIYLPERSSLRREHNSEASSQKARHTWGNNNVS
jgi:hypothetical protein